MGHPSRQMQKTFALSLLLLLFAVFSAMIANFIGALVFAAASALMFYPLQLQLENRMRPEAAAGINLLLLLLVIVVPATLLFTMAASQALSFADDASSWIGSRLDRESPFASFQLPDWVPFAVEFDTIKAELTSKAGQIAGALGRYLVSTLSQLSQATALFLLNVFIGAYVFYYCLIKGHNLQQSVMQSLPLDQEAREDLVHISSAVTRSVLKSTVIIGAIQGLLSGFAFWLVDVRASVFWGVVMGFLSVIPFIGPVIIWLPVAVYFVAAGDYFQAMFLAAWFWLIVASVDNVLRPRLIGPDTRMPDVLVLMTTVGGLFMFGAIGLLIGPLIGALLMAAWAVYRRAFAEELNLDQDAEDISEEVPA